MLRKLNLVIGFYFINHSLAPENKKKDWNNEENEGPKKSHLYQMPLFF